MSKPPNYIKFYNQYLHLDISPSFSGEYQTECPLLNCRKEDHFYANVDSGLWHCKRCDTSGNNQSLITLLHSQALEQTVLQQLKFISNVRKIDVEILKLANFAYDEFYDRWYVPYYTFDINKRSYSSFLNNLGIFYPSLSNPREQFKIHKGASFVTQLYNPGIMKEDVDLENAYVSEGEWDGLAYYEHYLDRYILGKPGAGFTQYAVKALKLSMYIHTMLDNDSGGQKQTSRAIEILREEVPKATILSVDWTTIPKAPKDVRDLHIQKRIELIEESFTVMQTPNQSIHATEKMDREGNEEADPASYIRDIDTVEPVHGFDNYTNQLINNNLELSPKTCNSVLALLAIPLTTHIGGIPIWTFLRGPGSAGKTTFTDSFGGENQLFDCLSKISAKSLVSGYRDEEGLTTSYLPLLINKTLCIKDFTVTLMSSPDELNEVMGTLTDIYDGRIKIHYGNAKLNDFKNTHFNMIACVTPIIDGFNASNIGDRFLRIDWLGDDTNRAKFTQNAIASLDKEKEINKQRISQLTLGYLKGQMATEIKTKMDWEVIATLQQLADFTATLSTKIVTDRHDGMKFRPEPQLGARIGKQLGKIYLGVRHMVGDDKGMEVARKVAFDTCKGFPLDIVKHLLINKYTTRNEVGDALNLSSTQAHKLISELITLKIITETRTYQSGRGRPTQNYTIHPDLRPALEDGSYSKTRPIIEPKTNVSRLVPPRRTKPT